jgi:hypothetical protein
MTWSRSVANFASSDFIGSETCGRTAIAAVILFGDSCPARDTHGRQKTLWRME